MSKLSIPASPYAEGFAMSEKQFAFYNSLISQLSAYGYGIKPVEASFRRFISKRRASELIEMQLETLDWAKANLTK